MLKRENKFKSFYTFNVGMLIYSIILNFKCTSYLELGSGFGPIMLLAGMGLKDCKREYRIKEKYSLTGMDLKDDRITEARKILADNGIVGTVLKVNVAEAEWSKRVDILFIDCGHRTIQSLVNKYSPFVDVAIFIHDVSPNKKINLPDNFLPITIGEQKAILAINKKYIY